MSEEMKQIADRLKEMREICGYSTEDVSSHLNISHEQYLSYEKSGDDIPISILYELTNYYDLDMTEILTGQSPKLNTYCAVKKGYSIGIDRYPGYHFESLAYKFKRRIMEPLMVTVEPDNKKMSLITHPGQEFNYVIEGTVKVILDDEEIVLDAGDCIYFNPMIPHGQKAMNGKPAKFLTVIAE